MAYPVSPAEDGSAIYDGLDSLTVRQINPDTGATTATSMGVTVLSWIQLGAPIFIGDGESYSTTRRYWLVASEVSFEPRARDQIVDADGVVWKIDNANLEGFDTTWVVDATAKQSNA